MDRKTAEKAEQLLKWLRDNERQREHIHTLYKAVRDGDAPSLDELTNMTLALNQKVAIDLESALGAL